MLTETEYPEGHFKLTKAFKVKSITRDQWREDECPSSVSASSGSRMPTTDQSGATYREETKIKDMSSHWENRQLLKNHLEFTQNTNQF